MSLWRDPDDVPHCRILSPDKTEWQLISATLCGWRRCFVADQLWLMTRDQPNSRFHGRDIFREIGLLLWKTPISVKFREIHDFSWILALLLSFMKVFKLSTAFVRILLFAMCHTSALSSWHVFTVLLTYIQSWVLTYYINKNNKYLLFRNLNALVDKFLNLH